MLKGDTIATDNMQWAFTSTLLGPSYRSGFELLGPETLWFCLVKLNPEFFSSFCHNNLHSATNVLCDADCSPCHFWSGYHLVNHR